MATSYVEFIKNGFWTHDAFLEGLSYLLAREFIKFENKQPWQLELINEWLIAAKAGFSGCVPSYFNSFNTHDKVQILRATLIDISNQIRVNPNFVTVPELKENTSRTDWVDPDLTRLVHIIRLSTDLIDGKLKTDASSLIDYWDGK